MTYRESCGAIRGVLDHQAAREPLCGFCAQAEAVARVTAEGVPERPHPAPGGLGPVSEMEAAAHRNVLLAALDAFGEDHPHSSDNRYAGPDELARRRAARRVA